MPNTSCSFQLRGRRSPTGRRRMRPHLSWLPSAAGLLNTVRSLVTRSTHACGETTCRWTERISPCAFAVCERSSRTIHPIGATSRPIGAWATPGSLSLEWAMPPGGLPAQCPLDIVMVSSAVPTVRALVPGIWMPYAFCLEFARTDSSAPATAREPAGVGRRDRATPRAISRDRGSERLPKTATLNKRLLPGPQSTSA